MAKEKEEPKRDILDEMKATERKLRSIMLIRSMEQLKTMAREILELKKKTELTLSELGLDEKDAKRVIDFVNSLDEVQLSEEDVKDLRDEVREHIKDEKKDVQKKFQNNLEKLVTDKGTNWNLYSNNQLVSYKSGTFGRVGYTTTTDSTRAAVYTAQLTGDNLSLTSEDNELNVKI